jgi:hypothetical protein
LALLLSKYLQPCPPILTAQKWVSLDGYRIWGNLKVGIRVLSQEKGKCRRDTFDIGITEHS